MTATVTATATARGLDLPHFGPPCLLKRPTGDAPTLPAGASGDPSVTPTTASMHSQRNRHRTWCLRRTAPNCHRHDVCKQRVWSRFWSRFPPFTTVRLSDDAHLLCGRSRGRRRGTRTRRPAKRAQASLLRDRRLCKVSRRSACSRPPVVCGLGRRRNCARVMSIGPRAVSALSRIAASSSSNLII